MMHDICTSARAATFQRLRRTAEDAHICGAIEAASVHQYKKTAQELYLSEQER